MGVGHKEEHKHRNDPKNISVQVQAVAVKSIGGTVPFDFQEKFLDKVNALCCPLGRMRCVSDHPPASVVHVVDQDHQKAHARVYKNNGRDGFQIGQINPQQGQAKGSDEQYAVRKTVAVKAVSI